MKPFPEIPGVELFLAGGFIRDSLLGLTPHDRDFVALTKLTFDELVKAVETAGGTVFLAKPEFLTIRCRFGKEAIDIALPRSENNYTDGRHPDTVNRVDTLKEDASRRDFTINSMYMDKHGNIIDEFDGQKDLANNKLRTVGDPNKRYEEDYLRILRGVRFAIKYDLIVENEQVLALIENAQMLNNVPMERVKDEINKCLILKPYITFNWIKVLKIERILKDMGLWFELTNKKRPKQC